VRGYTRAAELPRASVVITTTAGAKRFTRTSVMMSAERSSKFFVRSEAGRVLSACHGYAKCIREVFGTPWSRNSAWSARILRLLRMNAS